jgi:hypothetical protein
MHLQWKKDDVDPLARCRVSIFEERADFDGPAFLVLWAPPAVLALWDVHLLMFGLHPSMISIEEPPAVHFAAQAFGVTVGIAHAGELVRLVLMEAEGAKDTPRPEMVEIVPSRK